MHPTPPPETGSSATPRMRGTLLRALADFQTELFRVMAGLIPATARWELRRELAERVYRDARRVQDLRQRCRELAAPGASRHCSQAVPGVDLIRHLCEAADPATAFRGIFGVVKPHLLEVLHALRTEDLRVFDAPSLPIIEANIAELTRQLDWAHQQPELTHAVDPAWLAELERRAGELPGQLAADRAPRAAWVNHARKLGRLPVARAVRPTGFEEGSARAPAEGDTDYRARARFHAHNFLMEMQAADSCASLLFDAPDMPWEFYHDTARHLWDETRHCEFGELKLRQLGEDIMALGLSTTAYDMRQTLDPIDRYAALTTQEADAFPGKHAGLREALAQGDELSARAWSYDIADETQHVRYGHTWIPVMIELTGEPRSYDEIKRDAEHWRREVLAAAYAPARRAFTAAAATSPAAPAA
jgi:hypothetical protein